MKEHKTDMNITKIGKYKKLIVTQHKADMNIIKIEIYKKLIMTEQKIDINIAKIEKYKNRNSTSTAEYKANMNITE